MVCSELSLRLLCQQWLEGVLGFCHGTQQKGVVVSNQVCSEQTHSTAQEQTGEEETEHSTDQSTRKQHLGTVV